MPSSFHLPPSEFESRFGFPPLKKADPIVTHCGKGGRATKAAKALTEVRWRLEKHTSSHLTEYVALPVFTCKAVTKRRKRNHTPCVSFVSNQSTIILALLLVKITGAQLSDEAFDCIVSIFYFCQEGFTDVRIFLGGFKEWSTTGEDVEGFQPVQEVAK